MTIPLQKKQNFLQIKFFYIICFYLQYLCRRVRATAAAALAESATTAAAAVGTSDRQWERIAVLLAAMTGNGKLDFAQPGQHLLKKNRVYRCQKFKSVKVFHFYIKIDIIALHFWSPDERVGSARAVQ